MSDAPVYHIDRDAFAADPYPDLARMRAEAPIAFVPEIGATLFTRRDDIYVQEKRTEVYLASQPQGRMTRLIGDNMVRKDGAVHQAERRIMFPAVSPRTVRDHWLPRFRAICEARLDEIAPRGQADLLADFAIPVSGAALCAMTGLVNMTPAQMDAVSQAMIAGFSNIADDPHVEARCYAATVEIDARISERMDALSHTPDCSILSVQMQGGLDEASLRANLKLVISGGQNEPRAAIAGTAWALLAHPEALEAVRAGRASWGQAFDEYARLVAPIGTGTRRVARRDRVNGVTLEPEDMVIFMFRSANHDEAYFPDPTRYDIGRDTGPALTFGAGPHFCIGAAAARCLIAEVALPMLFARLPRLELAGEAPFHGWGFRGPLRVPVRWQA